MLLFTHFLKKYSPWLLLCAGVLLYATSVWKELPPPQLSFTRTVECAAAAFAVVPISLILYEPTEIELGLACGIRTARFAYTRFIPCLLYTLIPAVVISALYNYVPKLSDPDYIGIIPIYVPGNYRLLLALSTAVTVLFFASLTLFLRVVLRNCFVALSAGLISVIAMHSLSTSLSGGVFPLVLSYVNPFVTSYFVGDGIGNLFPQIGLANVWTVNRVIFLVISVVLLAVTYLLLRRERLHEVGND